MDIRKLPPGRNPPDELNVLIEVPLRSDPIKYEYDKETGFIFVDRYLYTTMFYPCNYGFIPNTLGGDGDPLDVMVVGRMPVVTGAILRSRPIDPGLAASAVARGPRNRCYPISAPVARRGLSAATRAGSTCASWPSASCWRTSSPPS